MVEAGALLCVANYSANTGYAWDFIESLYARVADHLAEHGIRTLVAYPAIPMPPRSLEGSAAEAIALDASLATSDSVRAIADTIRRENVRVVYLTDRPARCRAYLRFRRAGARLVLVHDHSSGERTRPRGFMRIAKWLLARLPGITVDTLFVVSDYVARRQIETGLIPPSRVVRVWHGLAVNASDASAGLARQLLGVATDRPIVMCACRATPEKGVAHLLRAFDRVVQEWRLPRGRPLLVYIGDGPQMAELRALRESLSARDDVLFTGHRPEARTILPCADVCVVPSVWQEAFGLSVLEAMASGRAVIATSVGGIPEMIEHDRTGLLVPPGDESALTGALTALLENPQRAMRLGTGARLQVAQRFTPEAQIGALLAVIESGFGNPCQARQATAVGLAGPGLRRATLQ